MASGHHNRGHGFDRHPTRLMVLMFTDVVGSVEMKSSLGNPVYSRLLAEHDAMFHAIVKDIPQAEILKDLGDGFLARFATTSDAVIAALKFRQKLAKSAWDPEPISVRIGLHLGEVAERPDPEGNPKLFGLAADLSARIMGLARPGQILMTRAMFDNARQSVRAFAARPGTEEKAADLIWQAHGPYLFQGADEPMEVFEVGIKGIAPLKAPLDSEKAKRAVSGEDADLYGWRPAIDLPIVSRANWILKKRIGVNDDGEAWIAEHKKSKSRRVFKFCFDPDRLRRFKRELSLFRLLNDALGDRTDIVKLLDVQLDHPPFYLESEYAEHGNLAEWAAAQGGLRQVSLDTRLRMMEQIADAVAAVHSVGILHKCISPLNVLIFEMRDGRPRVGLLCDFGISHLSDRSELERRGITVTGFTYSTLNEGKSDKRTTYMYIPPESMKGEDFTKQGDVFALGVLLYQMVVGDLHRVPAQGWESEVTDPMLRDDIAQCIHGRPEARLESAGELAARLGAHEKRHRNRRWGLGAKIALVVGFVTIVVWLLVLALINGDSHAQ